MSRGGGGIEGKLNMGGVGTFYHQDYTRVQVFGRRRAYFISRPRGNYCLTIEFGLAQVMNKKGSVEGGSRL